MEGLISISGHKGIKMLYLDNQREIYLNCDDLDRVTGFSYDLWRNWYYGSECISSGEKVYKGSGVSHYEIKEGAYKGLWIRVDMIYLFIRFDVRRNTILRVIESGVLSFCDKLKTYGKFIRGGYYVDDVLLSRTKNDDPLLCLADIIIADKNNAISVKSFKEIIKERLSRQSYTTSKIYEIIKGSNIFEIVRRSDGRYVKRIS